MRCDALAGDLRVCVDAEMAAAWTVLFGASGSGKTSLLRVLAGLWRPAGCVVEVGGSEVSGLPAHRRGVGLVAQQPALFPGRTVRGNVAFGARDGEVVEEMLERFGLEPLASEGVTHLSGGEAQRVCLARALAARPQVLLLDESFTGLHRGLRQELIGVLQAVGRERGVPIVSVTHDVDEAFACADEVLRMEAGRVVARGAVTEVLRAERTELLRRLGA